MTKRQFSTLQNKIDKYLYKKLGSLYIFDYFFYKSYKTSRYPLIHVLTLCDCGSVSLYDIYVLVKLKNQICKNCIKKDY